jgi:pilus assembly protein FimV
VPVAVVGPHPVVPPKVDARGPARTGVQAPPRSGAPAPPRSGAPELLRTVARATGRTVVQVMPVTAAPPIAIPAAQAPVRRATAAERHRPGGVHLLRQARVHSAELPAAPPTADREGTAGRLRSAGARPHARVTSHGGQAALGRAALERVLGPPAALARTASPVGRLGPRPATGRDDPHQAAIRGAAPGPEVLRAGLPMVRAHVAEVLPVPMTAVPPRAAETAVPASLVRRVPPAAATRARVLRGRARTARAETTRAGTTPTGARLGHVALDPVATAGRIGRSANAATPPRGRHVTGRPDPPATAATGPHGRPAPATVTVPAITTARAAATVPRAATVPAVASAPGAASGAGAAAGSAPADTPGAEAASGPAADGPGPRETRHRLGRHARPGRSFQTPSRPSSSNPRPVPS